MCPGLSIDETKQQLTNGSAGSVVEPVPRAPHLLINLLQHLGHVLAKPLHFVDAGGLQGRQLPLGTLEAGFALLFLLTGGENGP